MIIFFQLILLLLTVLSYQPGVASSSQRDNNINQSDDHSQTIQLLKKHVVPFQHGKPDFKKLSKWIGNKRVVLLGDSTHGTREFYQARAEISEYLINNKGFNTVIIEGNWPGGYKVNRYIHEQLLVNENQALSGFKEILPWVWRNQQTADFIRRLRKFNQQTKASNKVSFYGMDLFSLYPSLSEVISYLKKHQKNKLNVSQTAHACFAKHGTLIDLYGQNISKKPGLSCQHIAAKLLNIFEKSDFPTHSQFLSAALFNARMNAETVKSAEYYTRLVHQYKNVEAWNLRESFMVKMIEHIMRNQSTNTQTPKIIIWAHNSHVGDARASTMHEQGEQSIGQLLRDKYGRKNVFLLGSIANKGQLFASDTWNGKPYCINLPIAAVNSYAGLFRKTRISRFLLNLNENQKLADFLSKPYYHRLVGVVYNPELDHQSNYFLTNLSQMYDALLFVNKTHAIDALDYPCH